MKKDQNPIFRVFANFDGDMSELLKIKVPSSAPMLATRNMVLFPGVVVPIMLGRKASLNLLKQIKKKNSDGICAIFTQKDPNVDDPEMEDLYSTGVIARLVRVLDLPMEDNVTAIFQAMGRCKLTAITRTAPYYEAELEEAPEVMPASDDKEFEETVNFLRARAGLFTEMHEGSALEIKDVLATMRGKSELVNFVCAHMPFTVKEKMELLEAPTMQERALRVIRLVNREMELEKLKSKIQEKTHEELSEQQREYFLQQQIKNIQAELGNDALTPEKKELREKASKMVWSKEVADVFEREMKRLDLYNTQSPEFATQLNYLQQMVALPWGSYSKDNLDIKRAGRILNRDHYGMEKVKERILEYLAVLKLKGDLKSPILCLYGPPGVGKTSLGKSIAAALNRKYVRMSLGGVHDESEIRGHRRTYIGAMPGRIIKGIQRAGTSNPVFILDEIDKVAQQTVQGDPSSALLEVLDPEQNHAFHDNFLDVDYDLSKVMFIATANDLNGIPGPLLDRMELIEVSGYITEEKVEIARRHLVPRKIEENGLKEAQVEVQITKPSLESIIEHYTRESGVRQLEKQIDKAMRKIAMRRATNPEENMVNIKPNDLEDLLGKPPFYRDVYQGNAYAGVVTGLAWTSVGGEILFIETSLSKGKATKLTLTGNLGDVMKESAVIALEYVKAHIDLLKVDYRIFDNWNIHIHVPEGATPKDGPSAGITIATSIASAITQRKVKPKTAMTGEITLRGKVLPVGGIKEKILAAKRAGIENIILCKDNKKDVEEIPEKYRKGVNFLFVEDVSDVWQIALTDEMVAHPVHFDIDESEEKK